MAEKRGGLQCTFRVGTALGPRLTQCGLGRGLLPYQVSSSSSSLATIGMNRKLGAVSHLEGEGETATPSNKTSPGPRFTFVPSGIFIHHAVWPHSTWDKNRVGAVLFFRGGSWVPIEHKVAWTDAYLHTIS